MQWIKAAVTSVSDTQHTVDCFILRCPYNKWPTLSGSWQTTYHSDIADIKPHEEDKSGGC
eukprot:12371755-Ditylum_brightwellii.AAC.1